MEVRSPELNDHFLAVWVAEISQLMHGSLGKNVVALILSTTNALGRYFFQNESASTLASAHICSALVVSQKNIFLLNKFLSLLS